MILTFGQTGQVARELALHDGVSCLDRRAADLSDPGLCAAAILEHRPDAVINAAAYTAVDKAESEAVLAHRINAESPGAMARACADLGIPFVSISSDYVFDGSGTAPWKPGDAPGPLGAYGRSKLAGERAIAAAGGRWAVLCTSWVVSAHGSNFVRTMLRLGPGRDEMRIVADQVGGPTPARAIAAACVSIAQQLGADADKAGIYHFAGREDVNWAGFARQIFCRAGIACRVIDISSADYPTPARRPLNSRLDCASLEAVFGIRRPEWQPGLHDILKDLGKLA